MKRAASKVSIVEAFVLFTVIAVPVCLATNTAARFVTVETSNMSVLNQTNAQSAFEQVGRVFTTKANVSDVYNTTTMNASLAAKANVVDVYNKTTSDARYDTAGAATGAIASHNGAYNHTLIGTALQPSVLDSYYNKTTSDGRFDAYGSASSLMSTHNGTYDHTLIGTAVQTAALTSDYYNKTQADGRYVQAEADTLQTVVSRGSTTTGGVTLATSSGNVGVGTTQPSAKLDVSGEVKAPKINGVIYIDGVTYPKTSAGIQAAIDTIPTGSTGRIILSDGTYDITSTVSWINKGITLEGNAPTRSTQGALMLVNASFSSGPVFLHEETSSVSSNNSPSSHFKNLNFWANSNTSVTAAIATKGLRNGSIVGCRINGFAGNRASAILLDTSPSRAVSFITISNCNMSANYYGILYKNTGGSYHTAINVSDTYIGSVTDNGSAIYAEATASEQSINLTNVYLEASNAGSGRSLIKCEETDFQIYATNVNFDFTASEYAWDLSRKTGSYTPIFLNCRLYPSLTYLDDPECPSVVIDSRSGKVSPLSIQKSTAFAGNEGTVELRLNNLATGTDAAYTEGSGLIFDQKYSNSNSIPIRVGGIFGYKTTITGNYGGGMAFKYQPKGSVGLATGAVLVDTGNIGIGTTQPAKKLSVSGDATVSGNVGVGTTTTPSPLTVNGNISATNVIQNGQVIDVRSYGAVGDGVTDDTAAIQSALTASNLRGASLYFPEGLTFIISPTSYNVFTLVNGGKYSLFGGGTLKIKNGSGDFLTVFGPEWVRVHTFKMDNITFDYNTANNPFLADGATNKRKIISTATTLDTTDKTPLMSISNCKFINIKSINPIVSGNLKTIIKNNTFYLYNDGGVVYHDHSTVLTNNPAIIDGNIFISATSLAGGTTAIETRSSKSVITNNTIDGYEIMMNITGLVNAYPERDTNGGVNENVIVSNNEGYNTYQGICIWSTNPNNYPGIPYGLVNLIVSNNIIHINQREWTKLSESGSAVTGTASGIKIVSLASYLQDLPFKNFKISNNLVDFQLSQAGDLTAATGYGIGYVDWSNLNTVENIEITDNSIINAPACGIRFFAGNILGLRVTGNRIINPGSSLDGTLNEVYRSGINVYAPVSSRNIILDNYIEDNLDTTRMVFGNYINTPSATARVGGKVNIAGTTTSAYKVAVRVAGTSTLPSMNMTQLGLAVNKSFFADFVDGSTIFSEANNKRYTNYGASWLEQTIFDQGGNVGVGTTLPTTKLAVSGTLGVSGATTMSSTLGVSGATTLSSTLGVSGATTLSSTASVAGTLSTKAITATGTSTVSDTYSFGDSLSSNRINTNDASPAYDTIYTNGKSSINGISAVSGAGDYFYMAHKKSDYTITYNIVNAANIANLFDNNMASDCIIPIANLSTTPFVLTITKNTGTISASDTINLQFASHRGNISSGQMTDWKVEAHITGGAWVEVLNRTADTASGFLSVPLHMTTGYDNIDAIRLTISGATGYTSTDANNIWIGSLMLRDFRPSFTPANALGALDQSGGSTYGATNLAVYDGNVGVATTAPASQFQVGSGNFSVTAAGNVGVGTITPAKKLDVVGNASVSGETSTGTLRVGTSTTSGYLLTADSGGNATWQAGPSFGNLTAGTGLSVSNGTGAVKGTGSSVSAASGYTIPSDAQISSWDAKMSGTGTATALPVWATTSTLGSSNVYNVASNVGIGTTQPATILSVVSGTQQADLDLAASGKVLLDTKSNTLQLTKRSAFTSVFAFDGVSTYVTNTTEAGTTKGTAFTSMVNTSSYLYLGRTTTFSKIYFDIVSAVTSFSPVMEYWNGSAWTTLTLTDTTSSFSQDGVMSYTLPGDWAQVAVNGATAYFVRLHTTTTPSAAVSLYVTAPDVTGTNAIMQVLPNAGDTVGLTANADGTFTIANATLSGATVTGSTITSTPISGSTVGGTTAGFSSTLYASGNGSFGSATTTTGRLSVTGTSTINPTLYVNGDVAQTLGSYTGSNAVSSNISIKNTVTTGSSQVALISSSGSLSSASAFFGRKNSAVTDASLPLVGNSGAYLYNDGGELDIGTKTAHNINLFTGGVASGNVRVTIDTNGNVGVGTTSPVVPVDVAGAIVSRGIGNVGIGTTLPVHKLDVVGNVNATTYSGGNVANWDTAYTWGNHGVAGYAIAATETLAAVTARGASTTTNITTTGNVNAGNFFAGSGNQGVTASGTSCVIDRIEDGLITSATCS